MCRLYMLPLAFVICVSLTDFILSLDASVSLAIKWGKVYQWDCYYDTQRNGICFYH